MKSLTKYSQSILAVSLALAFIPTASAAISSAELQASKLAEKQVKTNGKTYRFVKFYDKHSNNIAEAELTYGPIKSWVSLLPGQCCLVR